MNDAEGSRHTDRPYAHRHGEGQPVRALSRALGVTLALVAIEAVGGWLTGSLALLADAGHLLVDVGSLALGIAGAWLAVRPATAQMSYGYRRAEILAAVTNGLALWAIAAAICYEAIGRLRAPHPILAPGMLAVAVLGLAGNLVSSALLLPAQRESLNVRAALVHVLTDAAAAIGTIAASLVILAAGWIAADAAVSFGIAGLLVWSAWPLVCDAVRILMEAAPRSVSLPAVERAMCAVPGVRGVHDLHIWSVTAGMPALSGHVLVDDPDTGQRVLGLLCALLAERFGVQHATLQVETEAGGPWHADCAPGAAPPREDQPRAAAGGGGPR